MSIHVMSWVWANSPAKGSELLLLLAIADHAADDGGNAYPSQETLAEKTRLSPATVRRLVSSLIGQGMLSCLVHGGPAKRADRKPNLYTIVMPATGAQDEQPSPATGAHSDDDGCSNPSDGCSQLRAVNHPLEPPSLEPSSPTFAEFWSVYPHHAEKRKAEAAWTRASKRVYPGNIISGAIRYRDDPNRDPKFTKHPTTWLNGDCWTDDPLPARRGKSSPSDDRAASNLALVQRYAEQEHGQRALA